jgi:hypothetical protein
MPWSQVILNPRKNPVIKMSIKSDKARMSIPTDIAKLIGLDKPNVLVDLFVGYGPEYGQLKMTPAKNGKGGKIVRKPGAATLNFQFPAPSLWGERESELVRVDFTVVGDELIVNTPFYEESRDLPLPGNTKVGNALGQQIIFHYTQGKSRAKIAEMFDVSEQTVADYTSTPEIKRQHEEALASWRQKRAEMDEIRQRQTVPITQCPPRPAAGLVKRR